jgi:hypothetical protein
MMDDAERQTRARVVRKLLPVPIQGILLERLLLACKSPNVIQEPSIIWNRHRAKRLQHGSRWRTSMQLSSASMVDQRARSPPILDLEEFSKLGRSRATLIARYHHYHPCRPLTWWRHDLHDPSTLSAVPLMQPTQSFSLTIKEQGYLGPADSLMQRTIPEAAG